MANESFNSNVEAVTHDSDPKKLQFALMSQQPAQLFQQGETLFQGTETTDIDLDNAKPLGEVRIPSAPGVVMSDLTGGAGNKLTFTLQPPAVTPPAAENLSAGDFTVQVTRQDATTGTIAGYGFARMQADGGPLQQWKAPLGNPGAWLKDTLVGNLVLTFDFGDETSADVTMTGADLAALAIAQGYTGDVCNGTIDVTSLLFPVPNMASKTIQGVTMYLNTAFGGSRGSLWYFMRMRVKNAAGTVVVLGDFFDASYQNNVALPATVTIPVTPTSTNAAPQVLLDVFAIVPIVINDAAVPAHANDTLTAVALTVNSAIHSTPELASLLLHFTDQFGGYGSGTNYGSFSTLDAPPHPVGTTQTFNPTDTPSPTETRYLFYFGQMFFNQPGPITVDVPIAATDLLAVATSEGQAGAQIANLTAYAGTLLHGYAGYTLVDWNIVVPDPYASSGTPLDGANAQMPYIALYKEDTGQPWSVGTVPTMNPTSYTVNIAPALVIPINNMNVRIVVVLQPGPTAEIYWPLLTTLPYEIRNRNQVAFRFNCVPPQTSRPGDYTPPKYAVWMFGSQGDPNAPNGPKLWTRIPFNVVGVSAGLTGYAPHVTEQQIDTYPFYDFLPDFWAGTTIIFDNQEYATPWNYVRFLILPVAENDVSGYVLSITANAREI
jgi:hypothetical protein